jgi:hypothetical protein
MQVDAQKPPEEIGTRDGTPGRDQKAYSIDKALKGGWPDVIRDHGQWQSIATLLEYLAEG